MQEKRSRAKKIMVALSYESRIFAEFTACSESSGLGEVAALLIEVSLKGIFCCWTDPPRGYLCVHASPCCHYLHPKTSSMP